MMLSFKENIARIWVWVFLASPLLACGSSGGDKASEILENDPLKPYIGSPIDFRGQNSVFRKYIDFFEKESGESVDYPINFHSWIERKILKKDVLATCNRAYTGDRQILVIEDTWNAASESEKEQLIFHEMAHCREESWDHNSNFIPYRFNMYGYMTLVPESIMYPLSPISFYEENREYYLAEIFNKELPEIGVPLKPGCRDRTVDEALEEFEMYGEEVCAKD